MNEAGKNIIQQIFGVSSLDDVNRRDIEQITAMYPYFAPAQFLLAQKLKETNGSGSEIQLQKTAVYYTNPYWLNYLLHEEIIPGEEVAETFITGTPEEITQEATVDEEIPNEDLLQEPEPLPEEDINHYDESITQLAVTTEPDEITEQQAQIIEESIGEIKDETSVLSPGYQLSIEESQIKEVQTEDGGEDDLPPVNETSDDTQRMKLSSLIEQHLSEFKKPVAEDEQLPVKSSPYHTIDYFASQGIRADGQDNFSSRVRKFTDWLKQMKGASAQPADLGTDKETEQMIETIAQTSNETKDIVTEAMAEVLVKQGKSEKAIQLYKKLSFLNPAKSIYFASKIEALNNK